MILRNYISTGTLILELVLTCVVTKGNSLTLDEEYRSHVRLVNDYKLTVNGKGEVLLQSD